MYKIKKGNIYRGEDPNSISPNVLVAQLNNLEAMIEKHKFTELGANMRALADWVDMTDTSHPMMEDGKIQKDLNQIANILSAIRNEVLI